MSDAAKLTRMCICRDEQ